MAVLPHAGHPLVVVHRQHDHGARDARRPTGRKARPSGSSGTRTRVLAQRHDPVAAVEVLAGHDRPRRRTSSGGRSDRRELMRGRYRGHRDRPSRHVSPDALASLTRDEAEERAALLEVDRYDVAVDLRGLFEGEVLEATSTIDLHAAASPGASTFVDCVGRDPLTRRSTASTLDPATAERGRLPLPDLQADNVLVVASAQSDTGSAHGIQRTVDPSDKLVYLWTSFEPDMARRAWANFDQPDLKAVHGFTVSAPETWTVLSNSRHTSVEDLADGGRLLDLRGHAARCRRTSRSSTPARSTSCASSAAATTSGSTAGSRSRPCSTATPRSCSSSPSRAWPGSASSSASPFAQERYDQVFVPDMGGAMENWGCVTWGDGVLLRSTPTYDQRRRDRRDPAARDGPHVVRRPGDDAVVGRPVAQRGVRVVGRLLGGGRRDPLHRRLGHLPGRPASSRATASTWARPATRSAATCPTCRRRWPTSTRSPTSKGQAVLKQLSAYVGDDAFVEGLRAYFRDHAWGNTAPRGPDRRRRRGVRRGPHRLAEGLARPRRHRHAHARRRRR